MRWYLGQNNKNILLPNKCIEGINEMKIRNIALVAYKHFMPKRQKTGAQEH